MSKVYGNTALNRRLNRVGKPLGSVPATKENLDATRKKKEEKKNVEVYKDTALNRRMNRVGKPLGSVPVTKEKLDATRKPKAPKAQVATKIEPVKRKILKPVRRVVKGDSGDMGAKRAVKKVAKKTELKAPPPKPPRGVKKLKPVEPKVKEVKFQKAVKKVDKPVLTKAQKTLPVKLQKEIVKSKVKKGQAGKRRDTKKQRKDTSRIKSQEFVDDDEEDEFFAKQDKKRQVEELKKKGAVYRKARKDFGKDDPKRKKKEEELKPVKPKVKEVKFQKAVKKVVPTKEMREKKEAELKKDLEEARKRNKDEFLPTIPPAYFKARDEKSEPKKGNLKKGASKGLQVKKIKQVVKKKGGGSKKPSLETIKEEEEEKKVKVPKITITEDKSRGKTFPHKNLVGRRAPPSIPKSGAKLKLPQEPAEAVNQENVANFDIPVYPEDEYDPFGSMLYNAGIELGDVPEDDDPFGEKEDAERISKGLPPIHNIYGEGNLLDKFNAEQALKTKAKEDPKVFTFGKGAKFESSVDKFERKNEERKLEEIKKKNAERKAIKEKNEKLFAKGRERAKQARERMRLKREAQKAELAKEAEQKKNPFRVSTLEGKGQEKNVVPSAPSPQVQKSVNQEIGGGVVKKVNVGNVKLEIKEKPKTKGFRSGRPRTQEQIIKPKGGSEFSGAKTRKELKEIALGKDKEFVKPVRNPFFYRGTTRKGTFEFLLPGQKVTQQIDKQKVVTKDKGGGIVPKKEKLPKQAKEPKKPVSVASVLKGRKVRELNPEEKKKYEKVRKANQRYLKAKTEYDKFIQQNQQFKKKEIKVGERQVEEVKTSKLKPKEALGKIGKETLQASIYPEVKPFKVRDLFGEKEFSKQDRAKLLETIPLSLKRDPPKTTKQQKKLLKNIDRRAREFKKTDKGERGEGLGDSVSGLKQQREQVSNLLTEHANKIQRSQDANKYLKMRKGAELTNDEKLQKAKAVLQRDKVAKERVKKIKAGESLVQKSYVGTGKRNTGSGFRPGDIAIFGGGQLEEGDGFGEIDYA